MRENLIGKNILGYTIIQELGSGVFGTVYKAVKKNPSGSYTRALKYISIPTEEQYYSILNSMGGNVEKTNEYFENILEGIVTEVQVLNDFSEKDIPNVVRYYENDIKISEDPRHYDIFILMEYLTPLTEYLTKNKVQVKDIIYLGLDILDGLASSHKNGVIHRDVKIDNIFVTQDGNEFKIGDFGVSKVLDGSTKAESLKGTPDFIAPEVYLGKEGYNKSVDLYSLGIVLYRLLNYNRNPFLPPYPQQYLPEDEDSAFEKRMKGEKPDLPALGGEAIGQVILKAISNNKERFQSAIDFYDALEIAAYQTSDEDLNQEIDLTFPIQEEKVILEEPIDFDNNTESDNKIISEPININPQESPKNQEVVKSDSTASEAVKPKKSKRISKILAVLIVLIIAAAATIGASFYFKNKDSKSIKSPTFTVSGGEYDSPQNVQIQTNDPDVSIYYTTDGSTPSDKSKKYTDGEEIKIEKTTTLKSIALGSNGKKSPITSVTYTIKTAGEANNSTPIADNSNSTATGTGSTSNTNNQTNGTTTGPFTLKASPTSWSFNDTTMLTNYSATASSALADSGSLTYGPSNVLDNNLETAWAEGRTGEIGIGEKITLTYNQSNPTDINSIYFMNGYTKNDKIFNMNTTPTSIKVQKNGTDLGTINLDVISEAQQVRLPETVTLNLGDNLSFEILDAKAGPDDVTYDACISEIRLVN